MGDEVFHYRFGVSTALPTVDSNTDFDASNPLRPDAVRLGGVTRRGKPCVLIDNTGLTLPQKELQAILDGLIDSDAFGFRMFSPPGGNTLGMSRRESAHIQVGDALYRLIVQRYEARIEKF